MMESAEPPGARDIDSRDPVGNDSDWNSAAGRNVEPSSPVQPAVRWREAGSVMLLVVLADITLFRGAGYAGGAALMAVAPLLLLIGSPAPKFSMLLSGLGIMNGLVAARLIWQGSTFCEIAGFLVLTAFAMALAGRTPFVLGLLGFVGKSWIDALAGL